MAHDRDALLFTAVSLGVLGVVELALLRTAGRPYTQLYRATRRHPRRLVAAAPLLAALVVLLHLEGLLPSRLDPLHWLAEAFDRVGVR